MIGISIRTFVDRYFNGSLTVIKKLFHKIWKRMFVFTIIKCIRAYDYMVIKYIFEQNKCNKKYFFPQQF